MVILYTFINEEKHQSILDRYLNIFPENFTKEILKYRRWQDTQLSLLGRVLLKYGLDTYYKISDTDIEVSPHNKPFLKKQAAHFNISHSKNLAVCLIADFPVGIDVEFLDERINYLDFKTQMTTGEFSEINNSNNKITKLFTYWTQKEAVIKAHGKGMMIPLESFEVLNEQCFIDHEQFFIREIFIDKNYHCCVASNHIDIKNEAVLFEHLDIDKLSY